MKTAVLGPKGTFSDMAYLKCRHKEDEAEYYNSIDEVFNNMDSCDQAIVPIENTLDGYVQRTLDYLLEKNVYIVNETIVPVKFSLLSNTDSVSEINQLFVQFKSNGQCREFIKELKGVKVVTTESNMESYYLFEKKIGAAAIVPAHIAIDDIRMLKSDVTDSDNNFTRFIVVRKGLCEEINIDQCEANSKYRIPVYIIPSNDRPGVLYEILKAFSDGKINLISIMSRPTRHEMGTYNFYIEIDCTGSELDTVKMCLNSIRQLNELKVLGVYTEAI